jgi:hypothetical protein
MLLVCNAPDVVGEVLDNWHPEVDPQRGKRVEALIPKRPALSWDALAGRYIPAAQDHRRIDGLKCIRAAEAARIKH